jgi:hypothetical protein
VATATTVGRNERCPCGSGKKYKACCAKKKSGLSPLQWVAVAAVAIVVVLALISVFRSAGEGRAAPLCPPGQSWSPEHGHCH